MGTTVQGSVPARFESFLRGLVTTLSADPGVRAVFLGGSIAAGKADRWSDIDVYAVITSADFERVCGETPGVLRSIG